MNDNDFIRSFEDCTLPASSFHHQHHVKMVWLYLQKYQVLDALNRFTENLKRFAAANGKPNLYHETITWAYVFLIHARMQQNGARDWDEFALANPDLLNWNNSVLKSYYREETLRSDLARTTFLFPDIASHSRQ